MLPWGSEGILAVAKHNTRYDKTLFKASLAGVMLSFGGLFDVIISGGSAGLQASNPGIVKILGGFVFPVGLVTIVLQGLELLTSNLMTFPMAVLKGAIPWWSIPVNWTIVFFGNLAGSLFFAAVLSKYDGLVVVTPDWYQIFIRGIGCNWLVCVAVWQAAGARETYSKIIAIWFPIWVFVASLPACTFASMHDISCSMVSMISDQFHRSLIAAFLGNIIGALFVGLPAVYFYLGDWHAGGLRDVEEVRVERKIFNTIDSERSV
ncbi:putative formate/nitrite transporter [Rhizopogon vinicolor AM-OR11-026]|uniref:Putative formate/nitrite transporter n=1 Tax=Rhizopogon vinicolor AM-OR11-026 TaxID=1314800 RepID=A0A1B7N4J7_9AGAM|nr:putative formate/nitrite transporter [Rhizopogon vinicolor AM-OR11-026]